MIPIAHVTPIGIQKQGPFISTPVPLIEPGSIRQSPFLDGYHAQKIEPHHDQDETTRSQYNSNVCMRRGNFDFPFLASPIFKGPAKNSWLKGLFANFL
jgi:hypothetical protein